MRQKDFGPVPLAPLPPLPPDTTVIGPDHSPHTDACIRDAARFGFCNHTRLRASPTQINRQRAHDQTVLASTIRREVGATAAFTALVGFTVWLVHLVGWLALPLIVLSATGWLLTFTYGIPAWLTADLSRALPPDTRARLNADLDAQRTARSTRRAHRKRKGPFNRR